jgi:nicotinate-nucleotide adenylyltransferase
MTQRIGIMGGTFDPIHNGHLVAGSEVRAKYDLDQVIFVPTKNSQPRFKNDVSPIAGEHRYLMTVIACASNPDFQVSRVDIDRPGDEYTYTIDTLRSFRETYPDAELFFITGADILVDFETWKDFNQLFDYAKFVLVTRPGANIDWEHLATLPSEIEVLEIPALAISSTDVRRRVQIGLPIWYLVPDGIVQYISKNHLYTD